MINVIQSTVINIFIVTMLFWMLYSDAEPVNPIRKYWIQKILPVFNWVGITGAWSMFSPDPAMRIIWPKIKIYLDSTDYLIWEPTMFPEASVYDKFRNKKFHKFYFEVARPKASFHTKIDFIEYLLYKNNLKGKANKVEIYLVYQNIPPFSNRDLEPQQIFQQLVYTYHPEKMPCNDSI